MNASNHHHHRHHPRSAMNVDESTGEESFIPSAGATAASTAAPLSANDMQFSSFMRNSVQEAYFLVAIDKIGPHTAQRCMKTVFWSRVVDWLNSIDEQWRKEDRQPLFSDLSPSACIERWRTLSAEGAQYMTFGDTRIVEGRDQKPTPHQDKWRWDMITRLHREELKARELDNTRLSPTPQLSTQAEAPQTSSSDTRQTQEWDASREPQATSRSDDEQHQIPNNSSHLEQFHGTSTQQQQKQQREHDNLLTLQQSKACKEILQHPLQPAIAHSRATPHGPMHPLSQSGGPYQPSQPAGSCPQSSQVSSSYSQASQSSSSYSQESQPEALHPMDLPPGQRSRLNTVMFQPPSPAGLDAIRPVSQRLEPMGKKDIQRVTRRVSTAPQPQEPSAFAEIVPQLSQTPQPSQPPQLSQPPQPPQPSQPTQPTQPTRSNGITLQVAERIEESGPGPGPEAQSKPEPQLAEPGQEAFRDVSVLPPSPSKRSSDVIPSLHQEADETKPQLVIIELSPLPQISSTTIPQIRHSVENPVESGLSDTESYENRPYKNPDAGTDADAEANGTPDSDTDAEAHRAANTNPEEEAHGDSDWDSGTGIDSDTRADRTRHADTGERPEERRSTYMEFAASAPKTTRDPIRAIEAPAATGSTAT
ncbi:hypothetical protein BC939DRAFT_475452 [Gamsiella multidivaricata]|uniref:uncharacterized protein n=1 Tax=Gamsiella multidivaricata TaxID=101098 RepID=UPI00221EFADD|nr:uncharacterized protein BC939DRAFT_475452 [Gamsiella multidivaricata]KAI7827083.1 hypothetical protein BC939DRAFT_475452 [Gamsiella multidivaricata]